MTRRRKATALKSAAEAADAAAGLLVRLSEHPDVLSVGLGHRERRGRVVPGRCCLVVRVRKKVERQRLDRARLLPTRFRGFGVDVVEAPFLDAAWMGADPEARQAPLLGGVLGCSQRQALDAAGEFRVDAVVGTLGCVLIDDASPARRFMLGAHHVLYGSSSGDGDRVHQPLPAATSVLNVIGTNHASVRTAQIDCALVLLDETRRDVRDAVLGMGTLAGARPALDGEAVRKMGANGPAFGFVQALGQPVDVPGVGLLQDQILIVPRSSAAGLPFRVGKRDSGAVWVGESDSAVVALHVGGRSDGAVAVANPIEGVLAALAATGTRVRVA